MMKMKMIFQMNKKFIFQLWENENNFEIIR